MCGHFERSAGVSEFRLGMLSTASIVHLFGRTRGPGRKCRPGKRSTRAILLFLRPAVWKVLPFQHMDRLAGYLENIDSNSSERVTLRRVARLIAPFQPLHPLR